MKQNHVKGRGEPALVVGVRRPREDLRASEDSLRELVLLIATAGGSVISSVTYQVRRPHPATFLGRGAVEDVGAHVAARGAELVAVDAELTPAQNRNLEDAWGVRVVDRTAVILDIFALRARTREGKLQVELAQLEYLAPRLVGRGEMFSQQAGRIGTRGPGETQLEYDRRHLKRRMTALKRRLDEVRCHRSIHRRRREGVPIPLVSLVGYTNAGKSTLLNAMTGAGVVVEDRLFSTLDPTVRRVRLPGGREMLLADTVGFIRNLPHQLVAAFKATFEEMAHADLLLEVVDLTDPDAGERMRVVDDVLGELDIAERPRLVAYNKIDMVSDGALIPDPDGVYISALEGHGIGELLDRIDALLSRGFKRVRLKLTHDQGEILSTIYRVGHVVAVRHFARSVRVLCDLPGKYIGRFGAFIVP